MKKGLLTLLFGVLLLAVNAQISAKFDDNPKGLEGYAQIPDGYYDNAEGLEGYVLKTALHNIIKSGHNNQGYNALYDAYEEGDTDPNDGYVWDMYSENPTGTDPYNYTHHQNTCGNYSNEGDCYNREHLFPQGIFDSSSPMKSDYHHVVPSDGKVNGLRSNHPFGEVGSANTTTLNGSKSGFCSSPGYSGIVFEPIDEYKGDIARSMLYFATRYEDRVASWSHAMINGTSNQVYSDWFLDVLLAWHAQDPVSEKETVRNDAGYDFQGNRNPFIDHPEWVECIWTGTCTGVIGAPQISPDGGIFASAVTVSMVTTATDGQIYYTTDGSTPDATSFLYVSAFEVSSTTTIKAITITPDGNSAISQATFTIQAGGGLLTETFENCASLNWTTYSVTSDKDWDCSDGSMSINGYGGNEASDDWLISPPMNFDNFTLESLVFDSWTKYSDATFPTISAWYSTDYTGTAAPSTATWTPITTATWSAENSEIWTTSTAIDLSSVNGNNVHIAFQYISTGTGGGECAYWKIDNVVISGESASTNTPPVFGTITYLPNEPAANVPVGVSAEITDNNQVASANLFWGTAPTSITNEVAMTFNQTVYSADIPGQASNADVYFKIIAEDNEGATTESGVVNYTVSSQTAIDEATAAGFQMYPNPANEHIFVCMKTRIETITIFDASGRAVKKIEPQQEKTQISINELSQGIYFIRVESATNSITEKLFIK